MQASFIRKGLLVQTEKVTKQPDHTLTQLTLGRVGKGDRVPALLFTPRRESTKAIVVLAHPGGLSAGTEAGLAPAGLTKQFLHRGLPVLLVNVFQTGTTADTNRRADYFTNFFTTYNRTETQERVQDLVTACAYAQSRPGKPRVLLCGAGRAGLWALMAAPAADMVIADCDALVSSSEEALLARDMFVPGFSRLGGFEGAALLTAPNPILLHNTGTAFATSVLRKVYEANRVPERLREEPVRLGDAAVADWVGKWVGRK